jgi:hypothetical protein
MRNRELDGCMAGSACGGASLVSLASLDGSTIVRVCTRHLEISSSHLTMFAFHLASGIR